MIVVMPSHSERKGHGLPEEEWAAWSSPIAEKENGDLQTVIQILFKLMI
jgi:hypothetical protein